MVESHPSVKESIMTGEPLSLEKQVGEKVTDGILRGPGRLIIRAKQVGCDKLPGQIVRMAPDAHQRRCEAA